ncbi:hypothetical protein B4079_2042 [Bacillus cereus]|nr:hypothetical protein B4079_2042 [Bacillus cereus]
MSNELPISLQYQSNLLKKQNPAFNENTGFLQMSYSLIQKKFIRYILLI